MDCRGCGAENRDEASFCRACGISLAAVACPSCATEQPASASFCDRCGAVLEGAAPAADVDATGPRPRAQAGSSDAERRLVTVLFADAKGSTALTERIGDEAMYRVMQDCMVRMQQAVDDHGGTVTQFRGDGVMALFGAPVAIENAAVEAVSAALAIQSSLRDFGVDLRARTGAECPFRIGVNTGPVVVGQVGGDTLVDYTAIGDTANVAARLEQAAGPGEVFISEATRRAVRDYVECEEVGTLDLKGKRDGVVAFRAMNRRAVHGRLDAVARRGLSPYVGREHELALLTGFVERLGDGRGQVVAISGEAGIGKSRLVRELHQRLPDGVDWFEGRSSSSDRDAPWHLMADLLRRAFDVAEDDTHSDMARRIEERAAGWSEPVRATEPDVKWLLGVPEPDLDTMDPQVRRAHVFEALVSIMRDAATRRPVVLFFEDLHWADEASEAAVARMANAVADLPILLVVTYRPERVPALGERPWITRLALDGLVSDAAAAIAASLTELPLTEAARQFVVARTDGNPLFVEELTAAMLEAGALEERDGSLDVTTISGEAAVPESLHDVVLTRIDRLTTDARHALQLASVIGREFTRRILDRISRVPETLDEHLTSLESLELIRQRSLSPEVAYLFKHAIVHDVTYSTLLDERRRSLHRVVALATEELYPDTLSDHCEALARHWLAAGEESRALPHLVRAGERAMAGFSLDRAAQAFGQAADIAEDLGDVHAAVRHRCARLDAFLNSSDLDALITEAAETFDLASGCDDVDGQTTALALQSVGLFYAHEFDAAVDAVATANRIAEAAPGGSVSAGLLVARTTLLGVHAVLGRSSEVDACLPSVEPLLSIPGVNGKGWFHGLMHLRQSWRGDFAPDPPMLDEVPTYSLGDRMQMFWTIGLNRASVGRFVAALETLEAGVELCERTDELFLRMRCLNSIGWIHGDLGDHAGAIAWNDRCIDLALGAGLPDREVESNARLNIAESALAHDLVEDAADQLAIVEDVVRHPTPADHWMLWRYSQRWMCLAGELALARRDAPAALMLADECLPRSVESESPKYVNRARRLRALALHSLGRTDEAAEEMTAALAGARQLGIPPPLWRTLTAAAQLGDDEAAVEAVALIDKVTADLGDHPLASSLAASPERARAVALA